MIRCRERAARITCQSPPQCADKLMGQGSPSPLRQRHRADAASAICDNSAAVSHRRLNQLCRWSYRRGAWNADLLRWRWGGASRVLVSGLSS